MKLKLDIYPLTYVDVLPIHIRWYHNPDWNSFFTFIDKKYLKMRDYLTSKIQDHIAISCWLVVALQRKIDENYCVSQLDLQ